MAEAILNFKGTPAFTAYSAGSIHREKSSLKHCDNSKQYIFQLKVYGVRPGTNLPGPILQRWILFLRFVTTPPTRSAQCGPVSQ
jgi:hypothetical protein